ncbi:hypothetical protein THAOC_21877 [Thalassiosira oceanica]|uniref:Major facilitator superfamily (MFS) profile domain-containing protein n=1 Tax=Thalassiosira oceanica TaxID=159749 RepID=K0RW41_THAOC|nr:hypothetical protein THAOC_21877 [Thalassiosira oceanica]|eukprot:EJK58028.1 hypothetical protein THAOC_21877 [Thalassiosira oceanica]
MTAVSAPPASDSTSADGPQTMTPLSPKMKTAIGALMLTGFLDNLGFMVIMPTMTFYIREIGGTDAQYGLVVAAGWLAAFVATPLYGSWIDAHGGGYRTCWFFGSFLMITANIIFALAIVLHGNTAVYTVLFSRFLYGIGAASGSVSMTWVTEALDPSQLSFVIILFNIAANSGQVMGPLVNTFFGELRTELDLFGLTVPIDAKNGVGLLIASLDFISFIATYFFVHDPPTKKAAPESDGSSSEGFGGAAGWAAVLREFGSFKVFMPALAQFVCSANWQIIETALAPASSDALGWGPVQVSTVLGSNAILGMTMTVVAAILVKYLSDTTMVASGFFCWFVAGLLMVRQDTIRLTTKRTHGYLPLPNRTVGLTGFPIILPSLQALFSKAVVGRPEIMPIIGRMWSFFTMTGTIAGSIAPIFVGAMVLRSPEKIDSGTNAHELTSYALYVPIFSGLCIVGFLYDKFILHADDDGILLMDDSVVSERSSLLRANPEKRRSSVAALKAALHAETDTSITANKIRSCSMMGDGNHAFPILIPSNSNSSGNAKELEELINELEVEDQPYTALWRLT